MQEQDERMPCIKDCLTAPISIPLVRTPAYFLSVFQSQVPASPYCKGNRKFANIFA